jgi:predicted porin
LAGKYTIGQFDLLANYLERKSALSAADAFANATTTVPTATYNPKQTLVGLGVNYNLSKTTIVYARYEQISGLNAAAASATTATATPAVAAYGDATQKTTAVGLRVAF